MSIFDVFTLLGGLAFFLYGMNLMGDALERKAGTKLKSILENLTSNTFKGFMLGLVVTGIIQSSSATTVMVVGFVNSGIMTLHQAVGVIMGANLGTSVTSWLLSLTGIEGESFWVQILKPSSFTPLLAFIGIIFIMFVKNSKQKDTALILIGFSILMFGMETMSAAVEPLAQSEEFSKILLLFSNPVLGLIVGTVFTAIVQSSSASVGILQALAVTGQVSLGAAIPIIMGQNIGTCVTALISSVGANKNAKRTAFVHLMFNVIGSIFMLVLFSIWKYGFEPAVLDTPATTFSIAVVHTIFNVLCVALLMPNAKLLEKLALKFIKDDEEPEEVEILDSRLLATPTLALQQCYSVAIKMANCSERAIEKSITCITNYTDADAERIRKDEAKCDRYEDVIGTYLVNLSSQKMGDEESEQAAALLKMIGDLERISDHAVNVLNSTEELRQKGYTLTEDAIKELDVLTGATKEILDITFKALKDTDTEIAKRVQPLEQVIDIIKEKMRTHHIRRMQQGLCTIEAGFVWSDLLTDLERVSDHCSNIAGCLIDASIMHNLSIHETQRIAEDSSSDYGKLFKDYSKKYSFSNI